MIGLLIPNNPPYDCGHLRTQSWLGGLLGIKSPIMLGSCSQKGPGGVFRDQKPYWGWLGIKRHMGAPPFAVGGQ